MGVAVAMAGSLVRHREAKVIGLSNHLLGKTMTKFKVLAAAAVIATTVSACGTVQPDRSLGGAGVLGLSGAAIGAIAGPWGALIGFGVGLVTGGAIGWFTSPADIDLGPPIWR
jgi:hypothetical protein